MVDFDREIFRWDRHDVDVDNDRTQDQSSRGTSTSTSSKSIAESRRLMNRIDRRHQDIEIREL